MSIYIKGIKMPKDCWHCPMINNVDECCLLTEKQHDMYEGEMDQVQAAFCPLIEVPPHGRLIDADKQKPYMLNEHYRYRRVYDAEEIENAPTIIPADEEDRQ